MFSIQYKIINIGCDKESYGKEGFFQLLCNGNTYGEFYSGKLETIMSTVSVFNWFERMLKVTLELKSRNYVILSDTDSIDRWIEFNKTNENYVFMGVIRLKKIAGSSDIEYINCSQKEYVDWYDELIPYEELKHEVYNKAIEYVDYLKKNNCSNSDVLYKLIVQL